MPTQIDKAQTWLRQHGIDTAARVSAEPGRPPAQDLPDGTAADPDDWVNDAQRWYQHRARGVDVAQLLHYHHTAK